MEKDIKRIIAKINVELEECENVQSKRKWVQGYYDGKKLAFNHVKELLEAVLETEEKLVQCNGVGCDLMLSEDEVIHNEDIGDCCEQCNQEYYEMLKE